MWLDHGRYHRNGWRAQDATSHRLKVRRSAVGGVEPVAVRELGEQQATDPVDEALCNLLRQYSALLRAQAVSSGDDIVVHNTAGHSAVVSREQVTLPAQDVAGGHPELQVRRELGEHELHLFLGLVAEDDGRHNALIQWCIAVPRISGVQYSHGEVETSQG